MKPSGLPTVIISPGNGCTNVRQSNWYGHLFRELTQRGITCLCEDFPDPYNAKRQVWIPFIESLVKTHSSDSPENVVLVGHSSGAQATLRYAETNKLRAAILVAATYTDLGDAGERLSGYYPQPKGEGEEENPYDFESMKSNCPIWHQFHSDNDPFIPLDEAERVRDGLSITDAYHMLPGRSHFFEPFPELLDVLLPLCDSPGVTPEENA